MTWLPSLPSAETFAGFRPWMPPSLENLNLDVTLLTYLAVDEIIEERVRLSLSSWPLADRDGRLRFELPRKRNTAIIHRLELCRFLSDCGHELLPEPPDSKAQHHRFLRIGDVFAAQIRRGIRTTAPVEDWMIKPVYDLTADAREVAKLAYYGAVTERWTEQRAKKYKISWQGRRQ
jgi:hypothetical protein